jgi:hypothetical protein
MRTFAAIASLMALLALTIWYTVHVWNAIEGPPMPTYGYVLAAAGVALSMLVGSGLIALMYFSSRHGYDEAHEVEHIDHKD